MTFFVMTALPTVLVSFLLAYLITPVAIRIATKFNIVDYPCSRKNHPIPTPIIGGIGIFVGFAVASFSHLPFDPTLYKLIGCGAAILIVGIIDDIWGLPPWVKLLAQIIVAIFTYYAGIKIHFITNPVGSSMIYLGWISMPLTVIWLVSIMNIINLIDGLDGLAAGICSVSLVFLTIVSVLSGHFLAATMALACLGGCLGFLRFNFPPAKVFMGDAGAMFLGYMLGIIAIIGVVKSTVAISVVIPVVMLAIPVSDTLLTIVRRIKNKKHIFEPDANHLHHKLVDMGLSAKQVALTMYALTGLLGLVGVAIELSSNTAGFVVFMLFLATWIGAGIYFNRRPAAARSLIHFLF